MSIYTDAIFEFNQAFGVEATEEREQLYSDLIDEEYEEWLEERYAKDGSKDEEAELKEICDMLYVLHGYCFQKGWNIDRAFSKVHASNMSKLTDGVAQYNQQGKILKGPKYQVPDLLDCLADDA